MLKGKPFTAPSTEATPAPAAPATTPRKKKSATAPLAPTEVPPATEAAPAATAIADPDRVPLTDLMKKPARKGGKGAKGAKPAKSASPAKPSGKNAPKAKTPAKEAKTKKVSGLDLAAKVVALSKEPLNAKAITDLVLAAGWQTQGKTPHATLFAAIIREIAAKGKASRFIKTDRGLFTANAKAVAV